LGEGQSAARGRGIERKKATQNPLFKDGKKDNPVDPVQKNWLKKKDMMRKVKPITFCLLNERGDRGPLLKKVGANCDPGSGRSGGRRVAVTSGNGSEVHREINKGWGKKKKRLERGAVPIDKKESSEVAGQGGVKPIEKIKEKGRKSRGNFKPHPVTSERKKGKPWGRPCSK